MDDLVGLIAVGENGVRAPRLRWLAAGSEAGLNAAAETVLADPTTEWEECGTWMSDGPAVLTHSAEAGWRVRASRTKAGEENWVGLVQPLPTATVSVRLREHDDEVRRAES